MKITFIPAVLLAALLSVSFGATPSRAQVLSSGKVSGTVKDAAGAVVPGAVIKIRHLGTGAIREVTTNQEGYYEAGVAPGKYELSTEVAGFKGYVQGPVSVDVAQESRVDMALQVGNVTETVSVRADALQVQSTTSELGKVVTEQFIANLPLNGRNFTDLGLLQAGVLPMQPGRGFSENSYNVNGSRDVNNNFLLDGIQNMDLQFNSPAFIPALEALQEFKIQTSVYSAEYGRGAGSIVNTIVKSGTNEIHGSIYEFLRHDALDARNYFTTGPDAPHLRRNQFGAALGGPLVKDKLFWFAAYEGFRRKRGVTQATTVPTAREKAGDFSWLGTPIIDPLTGFPFPGNQIPPAGSPGCGVTTSCVSPTATNIMNLYPTAPNGTERTTNFSSTGSEARNENQIIARIDYPFRTTQQFWGRYIWHKEDLVDPTQSFGTGPQKFPGDPDDPARAESLGGNQNLGLGHIWTISPNMLNDFRVGYIRGRKGVDHFPKTKPTDVGIDFPAPEDQGLTDIRITGFSGIGANTQGPNRFVWNTFQFTDALTWTRGKHSLKLGGEFRRHQENYFQRFAEAGSFIFVPAFTGDALSDFLIGRAVVFFFGQSQRSNLYQRWYAINGFIQDDWRVTSKLTLNLGVRYEFVSPIQDREGRTATLHVSNAGIRSSTPFSFPVGVDVDGDGDVDANDVNTVTVAGDHRVPQTGTAEIVLNGGTSSDGRLELCSPNCTYFPDKNNFSPRIGFAYDILGNGKLAIRGGYGLFYNQFEANLSVNNFLQEPFVSFPVITDSGGGFASLETPLAAGIPNVPGVAVYTDPFIKRPYMQQFNFGVQWEFAPDFLAEAAYVGTLGRHLLGFRELNQPTFIPGNVVDINGNPILDAAGNPIPVSSLANKDARRPISGFGSLFQSTTWANSNYHGLQLSLNKRFSQGFTFLTSYTWSKSIDTDSEFHSGAGSLIDTFHAQDDDNPSAERGLSAFDMRHRFTFSGILELPFGPGKPLLGNSSSGVVNKLVGGWQIAPTIILSSGVPLTIRDINDRCLCVGLAPGSQRPNYVGGDIRAPGRDPNNWFNASALQSAPIGQFGNLGRNVVFADNTKITNLALIKRTQIAKEHLNIEFRAEFFNLFNRPHFGVPDLLFGSTSFGRVGTTTRGLDERQIQLALKINF